MFVRKTIIWIQAKHFCLKSHKNCLQVDLRHQEEEQGNNVVSIGVDLSEFYMSVEWDILAVPAIRNVKYYTCCDEPYLDITFNITMRRKTLFYTVNLIIPCMGISFLTVLVCKFHQIMYSCLDWIVIILAQSYFLIKRQQTLNVMLVLSLKKIYLKMIFWHCNR